jgi:hypothetical protein
MLDAGCWMDRAVGLLLLVHLSRTVSGLSSMTRTAQTLHSDACLSPQPHSSHPLCARLCPQVLQFPIQTLVRFWMNHHLLDLVQRPVWRVVKGRGRSYVEKVLEGEGWRSWLWLRVVCRSRGTQLGQLAVPVYRTPAVPRNQSASHSLAVLQPQCLANNTACMLAWQGVTLPMTLTCLPLPCAELPDVRTSTAVTAVDNLPDGRVRVSAGGSAEQYEEYDAVVFATHSDITLRLLGEGATADEQKVGRSCL